MNLALIDCAKAGFCDDFTVCNTEDYELYLKK